jgi:hydrogenase maturation protease
VIEPATAQATGVQMHGVDPVQVLASAKAMGAQLNKVRVVGCEPKTIAQADDELSMELSPEVARAVDPAVALVETLIAELSDA